MKIKQIFSDMDGTLLNSVGRVSQKNAGTIREAKIPFTLVSARAPMEMKEAIEKLALISPQIAFNGGLIFQKQNDSWKVISEVFMAFATVKYLLQFIGQNFPNVSASYYDLNHWYSECLDRGIEMEQKLTGQHVTVIETSKNLAKPKKIFKIMMITFSPSEMEALKARLFSLQLEDVNIQQSGKNYLEITAALAKKSRGISYLMESEKLSKADCAAFGDGHNDLPMFEMVALPIAMSNAAEEVKEKASFITKSNDEDGVAFAVQKILLNEI
ncbi:MAG: Cof-type HAD-IIB family hydrolase [Streptococcaceae bacterium]|nr:Cof-type HAD-IIB family hydrolase [Streptococcaceae bacterium]